MTDIVERLRLAPHADFYKPSKWFELMTDAADEIERLGALATIVREQGIELTDLRAEVERLRAALKQIVAEADSDDGLTAWDGAEIARRALEPKP